MELLPATARLQSPSPSVLHPLTAVGAVSPGKVPPSVSLRRAPLRLLQLSHASPQPSRSLIAAAAAGLSAASTSSRWVVDMEKPPDGVASSRAGVIDYYVDTLSKILGDEREAQVCIYDASWQTEFRFCCKIDQEASKELADLPCVLSVRPDTNLESIKSSRYPNSLPRFLSRSEDVSPIFAVSQVNSGSWMVKMRKPGVEVVTKAQIVDYYADTLKKVLGNEKDAQACIYHISWEKDFGFCCQIDEECARELADVPEVVRVHPDINFDSKNKDYGGWQGSSLILQAACQYCRGQWQDLTRGLLCCVLVGLDQFSRGVSTVEFFLSGNGEVCLLEFSVRNFQVKRGGRPVLLGGASLSHLDKSKPDPPGVILIQTVNDPSVAAESPWATLAPKFSIKKIKGEGKRGVPAPKFNQGQVQLSIWSELNGSIHPNWAQFSLLLINFPLHLHFILIRLGLNLIQSSIGQ